MDSLRRKVIILSFLFTAVAVPLNSSADQNRLYNVDVNGSDGGVRITLYFDGPVKYGSFLVNNPPRLVIYIRDVIYSFQKPEIVVSQEPVSKIRIRQWFEKPLVVRVAIDFSHPTQYRISEESGKVYVDVSKDVVKIAKKESAQPETVKEGGLNSGSLISMDYREAEITNVLRLLAQQNGLNIVASDEVKGKVTVSLKNVTLKEALENILRANGYNYVVDGNVILVKSIAKTIPGELVTKVYRLKYIAATDLKEVIANVISKQAKVKVFTREFQSQSKGGEQPQRAPKEGRSSRSSILVVTDSGENIKRVDKIVEQLDVAVPQIMIEAKLLEIAPVEKEKLGIDWDKSITASILDEYLLPSGDTQKYSAYTGLPLKTGKLTFGRLSADEFTAVLDFLREKTDSKLISNPRILAMDNQESEISVGTTVPIPQINRGLAGQGDIVTFNYKDVNIQLKVTPHITENKYIIMSVNPVIEEITGEVVVDLNRAPITSKRSVNTVVTVKDGETVVIGGLIKESNVETVSKVWLLGDIPFLGRLFQHKKLEKKQTDLLIFITPHIVSE